MNRNDYAIGTGFTFRTEKEQFVITDRFTLDNIEYVELYGPFPGEVGKTEMVITYTYLLECVKKGVLTPKKK